MKTYGHFFTFFIFISILFYVISIFFPNNSLIDFQLISVISQTVGLLSFLFLFQSNLITDNFSEIESPNATTRISELFFRVLLFNTQVFIRKVNSKNNFYIEITIILVLLVTLNLINLDFTLSKIDFSELDKQASSNSYNISKVIFSLNIFLGQIGGLFFQSVIVYLLGMILETKISYNKYFKYISLSYIGFVGSAFVLLLFNYFYLDNYDSLESFGKEMQGSFVRIFIGKLGEYWSLLVLSILIYKAGNEEITFSKSLINTVFPNMVIMSSNLLFNFLF